MIYLIRGSILSLMIFCSFEIIYLKLGFRIKIYELLSIFILLLSLFFFLYQPHKFKLKEDLSIFLYLILFIFAIEVFSLIQVLQRPNIQLGIDQYLKAIFGNLIRLLTIVSILFIYDKIGLEKNIKLIKYFCLGAFFSSIFAISNLLSSIFMSVDIEAIIENILPPPFASTYAEEKWGIMGISRGKGWSGVNYSAFHFALVLPLFFYFCFYKQKMHDTIHSAINSSLLTYLMLFSISTAVLITISRTGIAFSFAGILLLIVLMRDMKKLFYLSSAAIILILYLFSSDLIFIIELLETRFTTSSDRFNLWSGGLIVFNSNIFGVGLNNSSLASYELSYLANTDGNLHNSWLTFLVELGFLGLLANLFLATYVSYSLFKSKKPLASPLFAGLVTICVASIFNQFIDSYIWYFYSMIAMLYITSDTNLYYFSNEDKINL